MDRWFTQDSENPYLDKENLHKAVDYFSLGDKFAQASNEANDFLGATISDSFISVIKTFGRGRDIITSPIFYMMLPFSATYGAIGGGLRGAYTLVDRAINDDERDKEMRGKFFIALQALYDDSVNKYQELGQRVYLLKLPRLFDDQILEKVVASLTLNKELSASQNNLVISSMLYRLYCGPCHGSSDEARQNAWMTGVKKGIEL